jgi:L-ribulokinase
MFAAVAAGEANGGYRTIVEAANNMARVREESFKPIPEHAAVYNRLYEEYTRLHDYFGRGGNECMYRLKHIRDTVRSGA